MVTHTVVLAGGRATRLGGAAKPLLARDGTTLLDRAVQIGTDIADPDGTVVVVGPPAPVTTPGHAPGHGASGTRAGRVVAAREDPPFTGPARAIAAGVAALDATPGGVVRAATVPGDTGAGSRTPGPVATTVLVLACDMPGAQAAVGPLLTALAQTPGRAGAVAAGADGRPQWLLSAWRHAPLARACAALPPGGANESARSLLAPLDPLIVTVPDDACADIDTWARADAQGYTRGRAEAHEPARAPGPVGVATAPVRPSTPHTTTEEP